MLGEVKRTLEKMGGKVTINQNQERDGSLCSPWLSARWRVSPGGEFSLVNNLKAAVPEFHRISVSYLKSDENVEVELTFFPKKREEWPIQDVKITGCWILCPSVSV